MQRLLVATDLSARGDRAIARAVALSTLSKAPLRVLHVVDETLPPAIVERLSEEARATLHEQLAALPGAGEAAATVEVACGRPFLAIIERAEAVDADLVVLGMHREEPLADMFRGTTTERIIRHGTRPVLVVRQRADRDYRTMVVAIDFSVHSSRALEFVLQQMPPAEQLVLVHAYHVPFSGFLTGADVRGDVARRHTEMLRRVVDEAMGRLLAGRPAPEAVHRLAREGETTQVIAQVVEEYHADLLVIGTHGRTGVAHALVGSVAEHFLDTARCDVLTVRAW